jgi:hypothetical protein
LSCVFFSSLLFPALPCFYFFSLSHFSLVIVDSAANDPNVLINSLEYTTSVVKEKPDTTAPGGESDNNNNNSNSNGKQPQNQSSSTENKRPASAGPSSSVDRPIIGGTLFKIIRFDDKTEKDRLSEDEKKELEFLQSFSVAIGMTPPDFYRLAKKHDHTGKGTVSNVGMKRILNELKLQQVGKIMNEIKFTIDPTNSGYYGIDDFVEYFVERVRVTKNRLKTMTCHPQVALVRPTPASRHHPNPNSTNPNSLQSQLVRYRPPTSGSVYLKVIESYDVSSDESEVTSPLTDSQVIN